MRAIIIGGGIGGLSTAVALGRAGIEPAIYERTGELREVGAGLTLWVNAMRALSGLGLADAVSEVGMRAAGGGIRNWRGRMLSPISGEELERRYGAPNLGIHRADLQAVLLGALPPGAVHLGVRYESFEQDGAGVTARFAGGRRERADILVGADGIRSAVRAQLLGEGEPRYAGYTAWRGVARFEHPSIPPGTGFESWGPGRRFGLVHIGGGRVYWFATENAPEGGRDPEGERKSGMLRRFRGWQEPVEAVIRATEETGILRNDILDREPVSRWGEGRVTLLGDAAHPMTPNLGQGACQAIEDASVLAGCLREESDPVAALREYERRRISRTGPIVNSSRRLGRVAQWENPLARALRDTLLRLTPARIQQRQLDQLVGIELQ